MHLSAEKEAGSFSPDALQMRENRYNRGKRVFLIADHQPVSIREHAALGADLQISGHTHAGQFFPLSLLYPLFTPTCGEYEYDGAKLFVSAGASGWRIPFRTESHSCFEVVDLLPAEA